MESGDVVAIAVVVLLAVLTLGIGYLTIKVGRLVEEVTVSLRSHSDRTVVILDDAHETVSGLNVEIARLDTIIAGVQSITATTDQLVGVVHATVSNPMIKAAAYAAGAARGARKLRE